MPTPTPTPYTNGTAADPAQVRTDLTSVRTYLNGGLVAGDFVEEGLGRENLYRPDVRLVQAPWLDGEFSALADNNRSLDYGFVVPGGSYPYTNGTDEADLDLGSADENGRLIGKVGDRWSVYTSDVPIGQQTPIRGLGRRVPIDVPSLVDLSATFLAAGICAGQGDAGYTTGQGGYFQLRYRRVEDDLDDKGSSIAGTDRHLYVPDNNVWGAFSMVAQLSITVAGNYDFWVAWRPGSVNPLVYQIAIAQPVIVVEVHKQG